MEAPIRPPHSHVLEYHLQRQVVLRTPYSSSAIANIMRPFGYTQSRAPASEHIGKFTYILFEQNIRFRTHHECDIYPPNILTSAQDGSTDEERT